MGGEGQSGLVRPNSAQGRRQSWLVRRDALPRQQPGTKVLETRGVRGIRLPAVEAAAKNKKNGLHTMVVPGASDR